MPAQFSANPLVSIVMPVYGVEKYLDEAVSDALAQTHRRIEVVLVDDGSPDGCPAICDAWAERDDRVRVIHQSNGGLSHARNIGMAAARGEYLYFMDPDDRIEANLVGTCLDAARRHDADLVMFRFDTIAENGSPMKSSYRHNEYEEPVELTAEQAIRLQVKGDIDNYFWAFLAPRSTYVRQGFSFPEGRKIEDMARICNVIGESAHIVRIPDVLYHYRLRAGSAVHSPSADLTADWMQAAQDRREYIIAHYPQLRRFLALQTMNVLGNLNYETMRQGIMFGLRLDPESQQQFRQKVNEFLDDLGDLGDDEGDGLLSPAATTGGGAGGSDRRAGMRRGTEAGHLGHAARHGGGRGIARGPFAAVAVDGVAGRRGDSDPEDADEDDGVFDDARSRFADLLDRVSDSLRDAKDSARGTVGTARDTVKDTILGARDAVRESVADVREGMVDVREDMAETSRQEKPAQIARTVPVAGPGNDMEEESRGAFDGSGFDADGRGGVREALDRLREVFDAHVPKSDEGAGPWRGHRSVK